MQRLLDSEKSEGLFTQRELENIAAAYRVPLLTFYLESIPAETNVVPDFRKLPAATDPLENAWVRKLLTTVSTQQLIVKQLLEETDEAPRLDYVGSLSVSTSIPNDISTFCTVLSIDIVELHRRLKLKTFDSFKFVRTHAEVKGIFVLVATDLGSYHTKISPDVFRGIALADNVAPFVVVNGNDNKAAMTFTLLHELVHIFLGESGLSNRVSSSKIEKYCNDIASQILLPDTIIENLDFEKLLEQPLSDAASAIALSAYENGVSSSLLAYRAWKSLKIDKADYEALNSEFKARRDRRKAEGRDGEQKKDIRINPKVIRRYKLGIKLTNLVTQSLLSGAISSTKAGRALALKPSQLPSVM